jgi:calcineurin-like phosphoesterase family protein
LVLKKTNDDQHHEKDAEKVKEYAAVECHGENLLLIHLPFTIENKTRANNSNYNSINVFAKK